MALTFACGIVTNEAHASCGDWLADHSTPSTTGLTNQPQGPLSPVPCHGPNCRKSDEHAPVAPTAPSRQFDVSDRYCQLVDQLLAQPPFSAPLSLRPESLVADGILSRVDRPPRAYDHR